MKFRVIRKDYYIVDVEAESKEEAVRLLEDDFYLNTGSYVESEFGDMDEIVNS